MTQIGLDWACLRCGTRHLIACCHDSRHNLCDQCVAEQWAQRAARIASRIPLVATEEADHS